jgi:hypothetical protein
MKEIYLSSAFNKGIKAGQWIVYDSSGKVSRLTNFNSRGEVEEDV